MKSYKQVVAPLTNEIVIKKSRFITTLIPIKDAEEADIELKTLQKYSDATHNCYAYISNIIATEQRFSDDGEPQGTAGIPMLEVIKKREVYLTLVVVTRYFGGVKLGASGLVGAYTESVVEALEKADLRKFVYSDILLFEISYSIFPKAVDMINAAGGRVLDIQYDQNVAIKFAIDEEKSQNIQEKLIDFSCGKIKIDLINKDYVDYI